jgi:hypothetical protein
LVPENLFLRKQLALFQERKTKPRRADDSTRWLMATLSRFFPWRSALVNVKADTLTRWHRKGFLLFWRWKTTAAEGPSPADPRDGRWKCNLGRGTHRRRTKAETRPPGFAADRA